jgi:hypothetical protein
MKNTNFAPHILTIMALVLFIVLSLASGSMEPARQTGDAGSQAAQTQGGGQSTSPSVAYFTGDGGRGMSIAILAPQASGLDGDQSYLPTLVQGEFVSNFALYSNISVLDRLRLDDQYAELLSGYYADDAEAGMDLGHLTPTSHIMGGSITKTASGYALQMHITKTADKMTAASYSGTFTFAELDNLSGIRQATLDLLQRLGEELTSIARDELSSPAAANRVNAQTALAQGITAQQQGNEVAALSFYLQAASFDSSLSEAVERTSILASNLTDGISFSTPISGSITTAIPSNRYTFVLLMPGRVSANITIDNSSRAMPNQGADVQWLNADGSIITNTNGGFNFPYNNTMDLDAGVYFIEVIGRPGFGNTGTYSLRVDYFIEESEPNNTRPNAQLLVSGVTVRSQITAQDRTDMYRYELTLPGRLSVNITRGNTGGLQNAYIRWLNSDGTVIISDSSSLNPYVRYMDLEIGIYLIEVSQARSFAGNTYYTGTYILTISRN